MTTTLIHLSDVGLTLPSQAGDVEILRGIDLRVEAGAHLGVVGPSGSGKSSLLMVIGGLERASQGSVRVLGEALDGLDEDRLARIRRDGIGVVFQAFHLIPTMTALENIATPLEIAGAPDAFARAQALLEQVGLGHRGGHYPAQLSGGEQQRVALARALAPRPRLLLADEPTGNLDGQTGAEIVDLLFALAGEHGVTMVLVTHETALAARCNRVVRMADGRIVADNEDAREAAE